MKLNGFEIRSAHWSEAQKLVDRLTSGQTNGWCSINTIPSPDGCFEARYIFKGEIRFGPCYYNVHLINKETNSIIWDGGNRIFGDFGLADKIGSPWSADSSKIALVEWNGSAPDFSDESLIVLSLDNLDERVITRRKCLSVLFLPSSCPTIVVWCCSPDYHVVCLSIDGKSEVNLGKEKPHRNLLVADSHIKNCLLICNQLSTPEIKLIDVVNQKTIKKCTLSPHIFEEVGHSNDVPKNGEKVNSGPKNYGKIRVLEHEKLSQGDAKGNVWESLLWDDINKKYLLGVMRASAWGPNDYYKSQEWLELLI